MDDGGPSATAFLFIIMLLADIVIYGFGAAIHNLRSEDIEKKAQENENDRKSVILLKILNILIHLWKEKIFLQKRYRMFILQD